MQSEAEIAKAVAQGKREIRNDMANGVVPQTVGGFSFLFDFVDGNRYCGFIDGERGDWDMKDVGIVQIRLDAWLHERPTQAS